MTIRFLADENFNRDIVLGLQRRLAVVDVVWVQDVGLRIADDAAVLQWAADDGRVLITHDSATMPDCAHERVRHGLVMPGVMVVRSTLPIVLAIDGLAMIDGASEPDDWVGRVVYLPLRKPSTRTVACSSRVCRAHVEAIRHGACCRSRAGGCRSIGGAGR